MSDRALWETSVREHLDLSDVERALLVDHFLQVRGLILGDTSSDKLIKEVDRFVHAFATDFPSLENRLRLRRRQNWYSEKLRSQLEMF